MRVAEHEVSLSASVSYVKFKLRKESVRVIESEGERNSFGVVPLRKELEPLSTEEVTDVKEMIVKKLLELLTGRKIKTLSFRELTDNELPLVEEPQFGAEYRREELSLKVNTLEFYAYGVVRTEDGRRIEFQVEISLFNLELELEEESVRTGSLALVDPLVIDLSGSPQLLSSSEFEFDLEGDGAKESVPYLAKGKGFIFFDRNDNERADGGEIVGVRSGDAFGELRSMDEDGNGWIDTGDGAFGKLKVWVKNPTEDKVLSLSRLGVGALYTGSAGTLFNLEGRGLVRNLGIYLKENGDAGLLTKLDFVV
ncbi:hypothetical protein [Hydrogenivirga sp.]